MITAHCLRRASEVFYYDSEENVKTNLLESYEHVIFDSIVTAFGVDMVLVHDQHGGDVDTVHNVRKINEDPNMAYKNAANEKAYKNRGAYDTKTYHAGGNFQRIKHDTRKHWKETGQDIRDEYTGDNIGFYGRTQAIPSKRKAELDHIIAAKTIHDDRGRVLAGIDGKELADDESNFAWTNKSLNASMQDKDIPAYIKWYKEQVAKGKKQPMSIETEKRLMAKYQAAEKAKDAKINFKYYTSAKFRNDTLKAMGNTGARMGLRQALGFVLWELWEGIKEEWHKLTNWSIGESLKAVVRGIKNGFVAIKRKYKQLLERFKDGALSGILSSLTTTLCNMFLTTAKNVVRIIRQTWASLVQAAKILFINPDDLPLGEQIRAVLKILAAGLSAVIGSIVSEAVNASIGGIPIVGNSLSIFCGAFITGILGCTAVYFLDNSKTIKKLVDWLNGGSVQRMGLKQQIRQFEEYAAKLEQIDIELFQRQTAACLAIANGLERAPDDISINHILCDIFKRYHLPLPWQGDFDTFMGDRSNHLVFR